MIECLVDMEILGRGSVACFGAGGLRSCPSGVALRGLPFWMFWFRPLRGVLVSRFVSLQPLARRRAACLGTFEFVISYLLTAFLAQVHIKNHSTRSHGPSMKQGTSKYLSTDVGKNFGMARLSLLESTLGGYDSLSRFSRRCAVCPGGKAVLLVLLCSMWLWAGSMANQDLQLGARGHRNGRAENRTRTIASTGGNHSSRCSWAASAPSGVSTGSFLASGSDYDSYRSSQCIAPGSHGNCSHSPPAAGAEWKAKQRLEVSERSMPSSLRDVSGKGVCI